MKALEGSRSASSCGVLLLLSIAIVALALFYWLGPPIFANRCIAKRTTGKYTATIELMNVSFKSVDNGDVLVQSYVPLPVPHVENRLYHFVAGIGPLDLRTVEARAADNISYYDFKDAYDAQRTGCEVEMVSFTDGSRWEMPSPM